MDQNYGEMLASFIELLLFLSIRISSSDTDFYSKSLTLKETSIDLFPLCESTQFLLTHDNTQ